MVRQTTECRGFPVQVLEGTDDDLDRIVGLLLLGLAVLADRDNQILAVDCGNLDFFAVGDGYTALDGKVFVLHGGAFLYGTGDGQCVLHGELAVVCRREVALEASGRVGNIARKPWPAPDN